MISKTFYMMVGLPGTGKSTWCQGFRTADVGSLDIISTDDYIMHEAMERGRTYNEIFAEVIETAEQIAEWCVKLDVENDYDTIIWDQTNLTKDIRAHRLSFIPNTYTKIAVVFPLPEQEEWNKRLDRPGKEIPESVLLGMLRSYQKPTMDEGFDWILELDFED